MLMPSIFGENLFNDDWMDFGFPEVDKALYLSLIHISEPTRLRLYMVSMQIM